MRKNGQQRVEDDVNGLFAIKQLDIFDDINSPEAQAFMETAIAAMRDNPDIPASGVAENGRNLSGVAGILSEIDEADQVLSEFRKCLKGVTE